MPGWDDLYAHDVWRRWSLRPPAASVENWMSDQRRHGAERVFDMGCGLGRHTVRLAELGFAVVASDVSSRARQATRERLASAGLRADVIDADMSAIPYPPAQFDAVLSIDVMEHNTRAGIEKTVAEILRVLKPGGEVLASFTPRSSWLSKEDGRRDMIEDNTLRSYGPEASIHHMVDEDELRDLFAAFAIRSIWFEDEHFENLSSRTLRICAARPA